MSNVVKLGSSLPADINLNGLDAQVQSLISEPQVVRAAIVTYTVEKIIRTPKDGIEVPTIQLRRFEPVGTEDDLAEAVTEALLSAAGNRTGRDPLPLDTVEFVDETE